MNTAKSKEMAALKEKKKMKYFDVYTQIIRWPLINGLKRKQTKEKKDPAVTGWGLSSGEGHRDSWEGIENAFPEWI